LQGNRGAQGLRGHGDALGHGSAVVVTEGGGGGGGGGTRDVAALSNAEGGGGRGGGGRGEDEAMVTLAALNAQMSDWFAGKVPALPAALGSGRGLLWDRSVSALPRDIPFPGIYYCLYLI
jgi:hypothetical protein